MMFRNPNPTGTGYSCWAFSAGFGPYFFENADEIALTVDGNRSDMLMISIRLELNKMLFACGIRCITPLANASCSFPF